MKDQRFMNENEGTKSETNKVSEENYDEKVRCYVVLKNRSDNEIKQINNRVTLCLNDYETYFKGTKSETNKVSEDKNYDVIDIIPQIYNTSSLQSFFFNEIPKEFNENMINIKNIKDVIDYISSIKDIEKSIPINLPIYSHNIPNPICGCKYFRGDADLIMNDCKVSKYEKNDIKTFSQLILYSIGFYVNEKKTIKNFKIYNPLLGKEYHLYLPNLNFDKIVDFLEINTTLSLPKLLIKKGIIKL